MSCRLVKRYMGGSTSFNGTTSTIPTNITANTAFTSGFVLHGWIKPRSYGEANVGNIFDKSTGTSGNDGFRIFAQAVGRIGIQVNGGTVRYSGTSAYNLNEFNHFIAHVTSNSTVSFYINGVASGTPAATGALSGITTSNPLTIGNRSTATDRTFDGNLAELGIISLAGRGDLTTEEIHNLYTSSVKPTGSEHFFPLSDLPSTYLDTIGGATGTGTATTYSPDVPTQLPVALDTEARSSLSFDGVDDYVQLPNLYSQLNGQNQVAITVLSRTTGATDKNLFRCSDNVLLKNTNARVKIDGVLQPTFQIPTMALSQNNFNWITYWIDGTNGLQKIYVNGKYVASQTMTAGSITWADSATVYVLGSNSTHSAEFFAGLQKTVILHKILPTPQQIIDLHFNNVVPYKDDPSVLVLNLKLNEGAGTIAYDSSGNDNNATISGATWSADVPSKAREVIGGNLVKNGDFSYVPPGTTLTSQNWIDNNGGNVSLQTAKLFRWILVRFAGTAGAIFENRNGVNTLKVSTLDTAGRAAARSATGGGTGLGTELNLYISVKPNTTYTLSGYMETVNVATNGASIRAVHYNSQLVRGISTSITISGTTSRTGYTNTFTTPSTTRFILIELANDIAGNVSDAWFSDISLTETTLPTRTATTTRTTLTCP